MKNKLSFRALSASTAATALFALSLLMPLEVHARGFSSTWTGPHGGVYTREVSQTPGSFSASRSATLPNGKSASRSVTSQTTDTGRTTNATATGLNGKTATYSSMSTKTDTGYIREANAVGPAGATATRDINVSKQDGGVTRTVTTTATPPKS